MMRWKKAAGFVLALHLAASVLIQAAAAAPGPDVRSVLIQAAAAVPGPDVRGLAVSAAAVAKPEIQAEGAVVIEAATGSVLYGKNEKNRFYPASITKLMTALLVLERAGLGDTVTFSKTATTNLESGSVSLNLTQGDKLTVEQCLYALLLKSANEVGNGLAEHVSGSVSGFAALMNQKAAELGCTGTQFVNPHGLNDSGHYTTPYDMALVARAAFQNETLCRIATTLSYRLPATKKAAARTITMGHKMMYPEDARYYEGIIGGKTGYTSLAGNTLVTGAQRDGVRLIAVVMKSKATHYADTKALLDYGFAVVRQSAGGTGAGSASGLGASSGAPSQSSGAPSQTVPGMPGNAAAVPTQTGPGMSGNAAAVPAQIGPGVAQLKPGWAKDGERWYYVKQDGRRAAGQWLNLDQTEYWFDSDGYMATGWRQFTNGAWYYFRSSGAMAVDYWVQDKGKWFYLGSQGAMLTGTRTPDGYLLGADGAWIP